MKKIVLSLASVLAATAFAPEASAIPAYARQVGMACTACHAQHFPVLNSFGRAFKAGGYTMMGSQGKIEGEHLSLPDTLNASIVLKLRYVKDNNGTANPTGANEKGPILGAGDTARTTTSDGQWQFADEFALLLGGRVSENVGFFLEGNMMGGALAAGFKIPMVYDMGGAKLSVIPFFTDAMGPQMGYEMSSGGVLRSVRWSEARREFSAVQYNADRNCTAGNKLLAAQDAAGAPAPNSAPADLAAGDCGAASGFAFAASNDMGFIAYTKFSPSFAPGGGGQGIASTDLGNSYVRIAATPTVGGWAMLVGAGKMSGNSWSNVSGAQVATDQTFFDFEAHGEVGGKELGVYAQHARAPKGTALIMNSYNSETAAASGDRKAWTIGADYSVIPHVLHLGAAYRNADNGKAATTNANGDDALSLQAIYDLSQNVALHAVYTKYSGNAHNATATTSPETNQTLLMLEAAW